MKTRARFLFAALAFCVVSPLGLSVSAEVFWHPFTELQSALNLDDPGGGCLTMTPAWVRWPIGLTMLFLPLSGAALCALALAASLRRGYLPAVAPALAGVSAAVAATGLLGAALLVTPTQVLYGPTVSVYGGWRALGDVLGPCLGLLSCAFHLAPAVLLRVSPARLARPALGFALVVAAFFTVAAQIQGEKHRKYAEAEAFDRENAWKRLGNWSSAKY